MNESAFPTMDAGELDKCPSLVSPGMTIRDYFAAAALTGTLAYQGSGTRQLSPQEATMEAYAMADAMLAERAKKA